MGKFGQKRRGFGALPHRSSDRWGLDGGGFAAPRPGLGCAAPHVPGHGNHLSPFLRIAAPAQLKGLKMSRPPHPSSPFQTKQPHFFPSSLIGRIAQTPLALPLPWTSSEPFSIPRWDAGPGAAAVPRRRPRPQPLCRTASPTLAGGTGTRGQGQRAHGCGLCSLPAARLQTHIPDSAAPFFFSFFFLFIPLCWELAFVIDCV